MYSFCKVIFLDELSDFPFTLLMSMMMKTFDYILHVKHLYTLLVIFCRTDKLTDHSIFIAEHRISFTGDLYIAMRRRSLLLITKIIRVVI